MFDKDAWRGELADLIQAHELDQLSGVDANMLSDLLSDVAELWVAMVKDRDRGMPSALGAAERAELAALRRAASLQEEIVNNLHTRLAREQHKVVDLEIRLEQKDRALRSIP